MRLRVVFLTHNFPRYAGDISGAFLATLARGLLARGHQIRVVAPSDGGHIGPDHLDAIPVRRVRYGRPDQETLAYRGTMAETALRPAGLLAALALGRALRRAAREEARSADLIHAHWWVPGGLAAPPEVPLVLTIHGTDGVLLQRSRVAAHLARPLFRRARVVTAVSETAARAIAAATGRMVDASHIHPMPVETDRYRTWSGGGGGLVTVARLTRQKRVHLALLALPFLQRTDLPLTIIGDGPERGALEALAAARGIGHRVRFLGAMPPDLVAERLRDADVAVFPAEREGFGLAAAEALMTGVPVVACEDGGGVLSVVPADGAGRRARPEPEAIARAVEDLLRTPGSRDSARQEGARWRERLSPGHVAEVCEGWYREALGV